jgi:hypothetical protein
VDRENEPKRRPGGGTLSVALVLLALFFAYAVVKSLLRAAVNPWPDLNPWANRSEWLGVAAWALLLLGSLVLLLRWTRGRAKENPHSPAWPRRIRTIALLASALIVSDIVFTGFRFLAAPWESSWLAWSAVLFRNAERLVFVLAFVLIGRHFEAASPAAGPDLPGR